MWIVETVCYEVAFVCILFGTSICSTVYVHIFSIFCWFLWLTSCELFRGFGVSHPFALCVDCNYNGFWLSKRHPHKWIEHERICWKFTNHANRNDTQYSFTGWLKSTKTANPYKNSHARHTKTIRRMKKSDVYSLSIHTYIRTICVVYSIPHTLLVYEIKTWNLRFFSLANFVFGLRVCVWISRLCSVSRSHASTRCYTRTSLLLPPHTRSQPNASEEV